MQTTSKNFHVTDQIFVYIINTSLCFYLWVFQIFKSEKKTK